MLTLSRALRLIHEPLRLACVIEGLPVVVQSNEVLQAPLHVLQSNFTLECNGQRDQWVYLSVAVLNSLSTDSFNRDGPSMF
jgi:hypothetical protein